MPQLLATAVETNPSGIALVFDGREMTYADLDARSSRIAHMLIGRGIGPGAFVAIGIRRSFDSMVALWAVAKTGAAFVPVDPNYPAERIAHMITDSGASVGLTVDRYVTDLPDSVEWIVLDAPETRERLVEFPVSNPTYADRVAPLRLEDAAYIIYTSGSTGLPKGVVVSHGGLAALAAAQRERYAITTESRTLHFASPSFDASLLELLLAIGAGATMVIAPPDLYGGAELEEFLRRTRVTHAFITPAALASLDPDNVPDLRTVAVGGEAYPQELVARWAPGRNFHNCYGPTETTIVTNIGAPLSPGDRITLGTTIPNMSARVLDAHLQRVPLGVVGELYLSGAGVARGYHKRGGLTAERFVADAYGEPGARMYRTGDLVRWVVTEEGRAPELEYIGRSDFQVKVRGFRIELGEIDAVLAAHENVDFAATIGHVNDAGVTSLVSYILPVNSRDLDVDRLREHIAGSLPAHMVPASFMVLDTIPLTPNGKLDRKALPDPVFGNAEFRPPVSGSEKMVAAVFAEVLGVDRAGLDDDFFALGGNSLLATQVAGRLGHDLGVNVPVRALFESPTVVALARYVDEHVESVGEPLVAQERPDRVPLSYAQQRMWFLNRLAPGSAVDNIPMALRLSGELNVEALAAAISDVLVRHESLRTMYPDVDGVGYQKIVPAQDVPLAFGPVDVAAADIGDAVAEVISLGFDVSAEVPLRARLFRIVDAADEFVLVFVVHHIAGDGSSMGPLARDVMVAYESRCRGESPGWAPLEVQYADFALWQRRVLGDETDPGSMISRQLDFWRETLAGAPEQLDLPADRVRPQVASNRGANFSAEIPADLHAALAAAAREHDVTMFMVVHAALAVLLARLSGTDDIAIGTPVAGRGERALDDVIGMFVNTLVLRTRVESDTSLSSLLERTREVDLAAFAHADVPFERLVEVLNPERSQARHPLFQVALFFQNFTQTTFELPGLTIGAVESNYSTAKFDLQLTVAERLGTDSEYGGMAVDFTYATDLFDEDTIREFADRYLRILHTFVSDVGLPVGDVPLLDEAEVTRLVVDANNTGHPVEETLLLQRYRRQIVETPDAVAVSYEGAALTYDEFDRRVNRLARHLISIGVGPESRVALAIRRSVDLVVAIYAVLEAGGAYVPVDPDHPIERTGYVLESAEPVAVLTTSRDGFEVPGSTPVVSIDEIDLSSMSDAPVADSDRVSVLRPENTAYVIYTSGSTGRPKGVAVPHRAIANQMAWMRHAYALSPSDVYLQKTATTFDVSLWGFFLPLQVGAHLVIATPDGHRDPAYVARTVSEQKVTLTDFVPSMLTVFAEYARADELATLRDVFVIGEALPPETVRAFVRRSPAPLHNLYGPTEAAVSITYRKVVRSDSELRSVPIGLPQWNSRVLVLDARLRPVPVGVAGELYLSGVQLARGYHGRVDLTAERFVADPFVSGERMYRTGDLVRWTRNGELEYLGRTDFQVKFRGQRIELGEIETALLGVEGVAQSVTVVRGGDLGEHLVGYVVSAVDAILDPVAVRDAVRSVLPSYMVPSQVVVLDELPLNASGKLDRKALPEPVFEAVEFRAPRT
ncbi:amino acid adenylation domain-containing protein, partial [Rhodococcus rhodochrous]|nr:amino acid adenylation domain-containing protein [Rhodococcus rhodochrous]